MKTAVLLANIGSPSAPEPAAARSYLRAFLSDPAVVPLPRLPRIALARTVAFLRAPRLARAYRRIRREGEGAPLPACMEALADALADRLDRPVKAGLLFGVPSMADATASLLEAGAEEILLLPLFPQASPVTDRACAAAVRRALHGRARLRIAPPFFDHPAYIRLAARQIPSDPGFLLFSFHALPLRLDDAVDPPYSEQCRRTARLVAEAAGIPSDRWAVAFQSRFGPGRWLRPRTRDLLRDLPRRGEKKLTVYCPGFFCDGLETLDEIGRRGRAVFLEAGGRDFRLLPCPGADPRAAEFLEQLLDNLIPKG